MNSNGLLMKLFALTNSTSSKMIRLQYECLQKVDAWSSCPTFSSSLSSHIVVGIYPIRWPTSIAGAGRNWPRLSATPSPHVELFRGISVFSNPRRYGLDRDSRHNDAHTRIPTLAIFEPTSSLKGHLPHQRF